MEFEIDYQRRRRKKRQKKLLISLTLWILEIGGVILLAYFLTNVVSEKTIMPGDSMEKTLSDRDVLIVNKFSYLFSEPKRGDVVAFKQSGKEHDYYDVKRIIGLPGDKIRISDGKININGEIYEEKIDCEPIQIAGLAKETILLEENEYFVLGDNRNNSEDSRFANVGNIVRDEIIGKAWVRLNNFGFVDTLNLKLDEE